MAVLLKCGAVFLHIPKTGGSWVTQVLEQQGLVRKHFGHIHADYVRASIYADSGTIAVRGIYDWAKSLLPRKLKAIGPAQQLKHAAETRRQIQRPFTFCFVRHPMDWYESWWRYMMLRSGADWQRESDLHGWHPCRAIREAGAEDINEFASNVMAVRPGFVTELYSTYAQPEVDFVGRQERLVDDLVDVLQQLNVQYDEQRLRAAGRVNTSRGGDLVATWDPTVREQMESTEQAAMMRFGYVPHSAAILRKQD